jgi:flagellar hook-associated protein 3 FlgL
MGGTLNSIYNNTTYALHLHTEELLRLQEQAATGSRINRPSDDPSIGYRVLKLESQVRSLENYIDNMSEVISTLEISYAVIDEMESTFGEAQVHLTQIVSDVYDQEGREMTADQMNDILEQMVTLANSDRLDQYLFGGTNTSSAPYVVERTDGKITRVTYQGSNEVRNVEVAPGVQASAYYVGDDLFQLSDRADPIFIGGGTGAQTGTGTSSVTGYAWLEITEPVAGTYRLSIDGGSSYVDVAVPPGDTNTMVTHAQTGEVLYVDTTGISTTGVELVSVPGTYDVFNTLITVRDMLENERGLSDAQLQQMETDLMNSVDSVVNLLVQSSVSVGTKTAFLDDLRHSLTNMKYNAEDEVTRLEEADIAQVAIDISRRELLYEMSLAVTAELMSLSLLDFIQ